MKKIVLITGAAGFIGSHLCDYFLTKNYKVIGIDNLITGNINKEYLDEICPKIELKIKRKVSFFISNKSLKQKSLVIFEA